MATAWSKVLDATSCSMPAVSTHCFSLHLGEVDSLPSGCAWSTLHLGEREPPVFRPDIALLFSRQFVALRSHCSLETTFRVHVYGAPIDRAT